MHVALKSAKENCHELCNMLRDFSNLLHTLASTET